MKVNKIVVVKVISMVASVAGMIGAAWASDKQARIDLEALVNKRLG